MALSPARLRVLGALVAALAGGLGLYFLIALWHPVGPNPSSVRRDRNELIPEPRRASASEDPATQAPASGFLIDEAGRPVADAVVSLLGADGELLATSSASDRDGGFALELPREGEAYRLRVEGDAVLPAEARVLPGKTPRIMLRRRSQARVVVTAREGAEPVVVHLLTGLDAEGREMHADDEGVAVFDDLPPGSYQAWAHQGTKVTALGVVTALPLTGDTANDENNGELTLALAPGTLLRGRVTTSSGLGAAAQLSMRPIDLEHTELFLDAGDDGNFVLPYLPRGRWEVTASADGYASPAAKAVSASGPEAYLELGLLDTASISGLVVDEEGQPIEGAWLRATRIDASEPAQAHRPGPGLRWVHPLPGQRFLPIRDSRRFGAARPGLRPAECGRGHCGVDIGGERGLPVMAASDGLVVVASDDDRGKSGRYVAIEHRGGLKSFYMHLDSVALGLEVGQEVAAGTVVGTLGSSGVHYSEAHLHFAVSQREGEEAYFIDAEPMLRFAMVLPSPPRLPAELGPDLVVARLAADEELATDAAVARVARSDFRGAFLRSGLAPGRYRLQVHHPDKAPTQTAPMLLRPGHVLGDLRVVLSDGLRLRGHVVHEGGVSGAWVRAYEGDGESRRLVASASADVDGRFVLRPLRGRLELEVGAPGFGVMRRQVDLRGREAPEEVFELSIFDRQLYGQIVDPEGLPVAGAVVQIVGGPAGRARRVDTDGEGFFRFLLLPEGEYQLRVRSTAHPETELSHRTGHDGTLKLAPGAGVVLRIRDAHNSSALPGIRVQAFGPNGRTTSLLSDKAGVVELPALLPGAWRFEMRGAEHTPQTIRTILKAGDRHERDIDLSRGATLGGVVYDAAGDRAAGARVWIGEVETKSDSDGRFRLEQAPVGNIELRAKLGGASDMRPMQLYAGDEHITLELHLAAGGDTGADDSQVDSLDDETR